MSSADEQNEELGRRRLRQLKVVHAAELIRVRMGPGANNVDDIRIAALSAIAEARGVWAFLIAKGIATERERQDFLDHGFDSILDQVENAAAQIMRPNG